MDQYFKFKLWSEYLIPISIFVILTIFLIIWIAVSTFKYNHKCKWLEKNGFEKQRDIVNSTYKIDRFIWVHKCGFKVDDSKIERMKYKDMRNYILSKITNEDKDI